MFHVGSIGRARQDSGGVEGERGSKHYEDRLYLNGDSGFAAAPEGSLPKNSDSGSAVAAADVDRDGDLDLFVGGHSVPGAWRHQVQTVTQMDGGLFAEPLGRLGRTNAETGVRGR